MPKVEKQKMLAEMERANARCQADSVVAELENEQRLVSAVISAHLETCRFIREQLLPMRALASHLNPQRASANSMLLVLLNPRNPVTKTKTRAKMVPRRLCGVHLIPISHCIFAM